MFRLISRINQRVSLANELVRISKSIDAVDALVVEGHAGRAVDLAFKELNKAASKEISNYRMAVKNYDIARRNTDIKLGNM